MISLFDIDMTRTYSKFTDDKRRRLDLKVGYSCINDCKFCVVADKRRYPDKETSEIKIELTESYREGIREVVFTGGECTVREDILELVAFAKSTGYYNIQIQTNGRNFASREFCEKIINAGMTRYNPSLHGHTPHIHDYLTSREGSWRQTILGIHNVRRENKDIIIATNTVITKQNYRYLPHIAQLLVSLGVNQYQFAFPHPLGNAAKNFIEIVPQLSQITDYIKVGLEVGIKTGINVRVEAVPFCLMHGYEKYVSESYVPPTDIKERAGDVRGFEHLRRTVCKLKSFRCNRCKFNKECEGAWREYIDFFGSEELQPINN